MWALLISFVAAGGRDMALAQPGRVAEGWSAKSLWWRWLGVIVMAALRHRHDDPVESAQPPLPAVLAAQFDDFEALFRRYERALTGYLWRMVGDEDIACDLSQETFVRAWQHYDELKAYEFQQAWLFRVATNLALNHLRGRVASVDIAALHDDAPQLHLPDPTNNLAEREMITQILQELSPRQRAVLVLRSVYGLSCGELGRVLGISFEAAKIALRRARTKFRAGYLREEGRHI
jgi:RNA polymerase sigma-70 factor, ECF subfamily